MNRNAVTLPFLAVLFLSVLDAAIERPNIVLVLADDLGWGDPQCYQTESRIPTPAMNRMAREGIRFTDAHTPSSVCTPTRYSLLTGRYAWRTRLESGVLDGFDPPLIEPNEDTLAWLLQRAGYRTHVIGKWHLGLEWTDVNGNRIRDRDMSKGFRPGTNVDFTLPFKNGPTTLGFHTFFGISASLDMSPYCYLIGDRVAQIPAVRSEENKDGLFMNQVPGVTTEDFALEDVLPRIAAETVSIIQASASDQTPFFCYVPLTSPHLPVVPKPQWDGTSDAGRYGDFVAATDHALGEILQALDDTGQAEETLVIFTSDNGGLFHYWDFRADDDGGAPPKTRRGEEIRSHKHQSNAHWRGTKADIHEGGHRVPFLLRWPGKAKSGRTVGSTIELTDVLATVAEIVGESPQGASGMDSVSFLPLITGYNKTNRPFAIHHSLRGMFAIRYGNWKLIEGRGSGGFTRPREIDSYAPAGQLYNLQSDPQEIENLYDTEPERVARLSAFLAQVKASGGRSMADKLALSGESTSAGATVPDGFTVDLIASEPDIGQPIGFAWDHLGRLWIAECHTYSDRSMNYDLTQSDRIIVLSDDDNDGSFETQTVFADNLHRLTSIAVGFGGVWALTSPTLAFIPDADGDLVPDGPAITKLDGLDLSSTRHTIVNGLKWGPDGWLYGRHGIQSTSKMGTPGAPPENRVSMNTGVWRYHPQRETVELWTEGGTNPWGHDWNREGDLFYINTVIGHLWHGIPGAYTKRMYGQHQRPYLYRLMDMHADHWHFDITGDWRLTREDVDAEDAFGGGHAHTGLMIYQAEKWPREYQDHLFALNFHGRRVNRESLHREGSGWIARHQPDFVKFPDPWFRGIDIMQGPDGDAYVLDWSDTGECHDHDAIHRGSGRIYRIRYGETTAGPKSLPETFEELDAWLRHPNVWYARHARQLIQEIAATNLLTRNWVNGLRGRFLSERDETLALRYLHALHAAGEAAPESLLTDPRESIRVQAIYLLRDRQSLSERDIPQLLNRARTDSSRVRLALVSLLPNLDTASQVSVAEKLLAHENDATDSNYPLVLWYNIEPIIARAREPEIDRLLSACRIPELRQNIIRRLGEDYSTHRQLISRLIVRHTDGINDLLKGLATALEGIPKAEPLPDWNAIVSAARNSPHIDALGSIFGDGRSLDSLIALAEDAKADPQSRRKAIQSLAQADYPGIKDRLLVWIDDSQLSGVCAQELARFPELEVGQKLIERWGFLKPDEQVTIINSLITRASWAELVLDRIAEKRFTPDILSAAQARQINSLGDPNLNERLRRLWGDLNPTSNDSFAQELDTRIRRLAEPASLRKAQLDNGKALFEQRCANCHKLFGSGSELGPDLTGSGRKEIDYLAENLLYPSAIVPTGYQLSTVKLLDGRTLAGIISARSMTRLTLKVVGAEKPLLLPASEIQAIETSSQSLMPAGLLNDLNDDQIRDLLAFLMSN